MSRGRDVRKRMTPEKADTSRSFDEQILSEVQKLFNKVKSYTSPFGREWCLPDVSTVLRDPPTSYPRLQALKHSLNEVKNQLSDKDLKVWHQHTCSTNRAGTITAHLRSHVNAELCTQAWAKFYEILGSFPLLPDGALQRGELNTVHLCEAPGAFISAMNHFLNTSGLHCDWSWVANTLNPYYEGNGRSCTIADDRLIAHTLPWWFFGSDNTGDIMVQKHLLEFQGFVGNARHVDLITADGSFDCQGDPGEQESLVAPLQYCETVCALLLLGPGGSFVLKMFTLFEHSSVCLLYLLVCCFRCVHVFKPGTSKAGNSEVYVVCLDYKAKDAVRPLLSKLIRSYGPDLSSKAALFPSSCIPDSFLQQHEELCSFFHTLQVDTIKENLQLFASMTADQRMQLERLRECAAQYYMERFLLQPLSRKRWLCRGSSVGMGVGGIKPFQRKQLGSFNQRKELQCQGWRQRVVHGPYKLWLEEHSQGTEGHQFVLSGPLDDCDLDAWFTVVGATLKKVRSSSFCEQDLLDLLNEALEEHVADQQVQVVDRDHGASECSSCIMQAPSAILSEVCSYSDITSCVVLGNPLWWSLPPEGRSLQLEFSMGLCCPEVGWTTLHDGHGSYQRDLLNCVLSTLQGLREGSALVVPLHSALTRVTAGLVFILHLCFRSITFRCPSSGPPAALLCLGFLRSSALPHIFTILQGVLEEISRIKQGRQLLQFIPMDQLLKGELPHFLCCLNTTIARQQLHLLL
ncbi:cap-specific mRNA (nucleoside-2'-O-)-methyltransferase 2 [Chanos chanos]|uniref:Cap-specific mRNA (nucleoside-2'-O-)-methyltransferase 2 n=1 Tax=Chanos chanos TaxID=29144 RepID=A0A6J2URB0_CHACN|nr:cap-specific mRNA (nucleoside-2'-O-)-methyltransferase 2 [Chanos chanos]